MWAATHKNPTGVRHHRMKAPQGFVKVMRDKTESKETDARLQEASQSGRQLRAQAEPTPRENRLFDRFPA